MFHLVLIAAALAPLLHIDRAAEAQAPCGAREALESRLEALDPGQLAPEAAGKGSLEVRLAWNGGAWELELRREDRSIALRRELRLGRADCALVAESAALVIDRYLAALREPARGSLEGLANAEPPRRRAARRASREPAPDPQAKTRTSAQALSPTPVRAAASSQTSVSASPQRSSQPPDEPQPAPGVGPALPRAGAAATIVGMPIIASPPNLDAARAPSSSSSGSETTASASTASGEALVPGERQAAPGAARSDPPRAQAAPSTRELGQLDLALGPAALVGLPSDLRAGAWLELEHPLASLSTRLLALGSAASSQSELFAGAAAGNISAQTLHLGLSAGPCASGWARACASLFAGARFTFGSSSGAQIFQRESVLLVQPELGAELSLERRLGERFGLRVALLGGGALGSATLQIAGGPSRQLETVDLAAALLLGYQLF